MAKKDLLPRVKLPTPYAPEEEVPGPPQPEEFFPGFVEETRLITQQRFRAGEALAAHGQKSTNVFLNILPDRLRPLAAMGMYPYIAERFIPEELRNALLEENRQEFENLTLAYDVVSWKQTTMFDLPYFMVSGDVADVDEAIREIPPRFDLTDADRAWLQNLFGRLAHLIPTPLPAEYEGTPEDIRQALLENVLSQPDVEMRAVHNMTVEELEKAFLALYGIVAPEMPEGMTNEMIREAFAEYEIEDEELEAYVEERKRAWRTESAYTDLLRLGMENAEAPDLNFPQFMKMAFTQPALASMELLNKYFNLLPRPLAAMAIIAFPRIDPESDAAELEETYLQYRELGMGAWSAYSRAFQEWDTNIWLKIFIETMYDPTTYIGLGIATRITKPIPHLGKFIGAVERGWLRTADAPFKAFLRWRKGLPKIPAVAARHHGRQFFKDSKAYLYRFTNKNLRGISAAEYQTAKEYAVKQALLRPQDIDDYSVMVGRYFLDTDFVDDAITRSWTRQLGVKAEITTQRLVDVNDAVEMMFKVKVPPKETAARILNTLAVDVGPKNKNLTGMTKILAVFKQSTVDNALRPTVTAGKGLDVLIGDMRQMDALYLRKITSSVYQHAHQAGRATGWMVRMTDKIVKNNALIWIDRRITAPMANQYLLFTNYGPFNYTENMMRSFLGGGDILYPRAAHPTQEASRLFSGLKNAPFEVELSMRGIGRLDIAVTMPKTGETMVFHKGKIPFITRKGPLTYNMKIGNKNYPIASNQDWMDMWGDLTTKQRDWDMVVHYKQALREIAPDQCQMLDDIMIKNKPLLNNVKTFSKREASDIERVMWQDATVGPEMVRKHDVPMLEFQRSKTLYDLNKTLDRCTAVRSIQKRAIRDGVLDGSLIKDIDGQIDLLRQAAREFDVVDLQVQSNTLRDLTKRLAKNPPNTADDVLRDMGFISDLTEAVSDRISDVRMMTRTRAAALTPTEGDTFHRASSEVLQDFLGTSQREIDSMLDNLTSMVRSKKLLKPAQLEVMDSLTDAIKLRNANALSTRELDRRIINEAVSATPPRNRDKAFWDALDAKRSQQAWEPYWVREADLFEAVEDLKNGFMTKLGVDFQTVPSFVPDVAGNLTPAHVAYLMGVTGDDLNRALTKTGAMVTIRPKNKFITYVYAKARKLAANVGKSPDDIGFTKDAIGDVYDQMFRNLGIDPNMAAIEPLTPTMLQLDDVRHELHRLSTTRGIPQEDYLAFKKWIGSVADDLEKTPMHAKEFEFSRYYTEVAKKARVSVDVAEVGKYPIRTAGVYDASGIAVLEVQWREFPDRIATVGIYAKPGKALKGYGTRAFLEGPVQASLRTGKPIFTSALTPDGESFYRALKRKGLITIKRGPEPSTFIINVNKEKFLLKKPVAAQAWWNTKEEAMMKGRELHELAYPTYGDPNFIDSAMRMIYPFWCTPADTKILTKLGWKGYTELAVGEDVLTVNPNTMMTEWQPVQKIAEFDYDGELMVIPAKGKDIKFTPNHRWLTINSHSNQPRIKRGYELTDTYDLIPRALLHKFPVDSILPSRLAAILGWAVTDGYLRTPKTQRPCFIIYQSRLNYIAEIEAATGTRAYSRSKENDPDNMVIGVSANDTAEIMKVYTGKEDLPSITTQLSEEAAEAMWRAMMLAEGSFGVAYNGTAIDEWSQLPGPVSDAFQMLSVLLGKAITVGKHNQVLDKVYFSQSKQPYQSKQCRRIGKEHYTGKVWCPVTANGTWFANFNGSILPTGNTYESFRWQWLPRTFLRTPGTATAYGRYVDYTEQGYIPIPGTDIQFNPLRGTIFMGGFRRLYLRDYPEYYDAFPGMEIIDYIGRLGFYPGTHVMLPIIATGAVRGKPEWGEILPAWARTGLDAARAIAPEKAGKVIEHIFPDRFRDYLTMLTLAELGYDADELWKKRESGIPLTEEEEKLWYRAQNKAVGLKGMLFEQTGVFRIRPPEYTQMMNDMSELIEEMTGVPVEVQDAIRRRYPVTGKRFSDYYKLDALQQKILYEMESYKRWQGVTTPLYPSGWQQQDVRRSQYFEAVDVIFDDSRRKGIFDSEGNLTQPSLQEITRQWIAGEIGPDQWISMRGKILDGASDAVNEIGTRIYPDVPKTLEEMEEFYKSRGTLPPTKSPDQELLYIYHQLRPEYRWNWDSERFEYDFDTYYAKVDMMIDSLEGEWKQRLLDRIQYDWLPMEKLYWAISREYLRPYRLVRNAVLEQYPPELQKLIMRYEVARGEERQDIMNVVGPDGRKLISGFNSQLREARQRFRILDPELDAWCYFFGVADTLLSAEAADIYNNLVKEHLTPAAYE